MQHTSSSSVKLSSELQVSTGIGPDVFDCAPDVPGFGLAQSVAVDFPFDLLGVLPLPFGFFFHILFPFLTFAS